MDDNLKTLLKTDFSSEAEMKDQTLEKLIKELENPLKADRAKENLKMKKKHKKAISVVAASLAICLIGGLSTTAFGQEIFESVKKVTLGNGASYYDGVGENSGSDKGEDVITSGSDDPDDMMTWTTIDKAKPYLAFDLHLPEYLPAGYKIDKAGLYNDDNGKPGKNSDFLEVAYNNGKKGNIQLSLRNMTEDTSFEADLGPIKKVKINGKTGAFMKDGRMLDIEMDGVLYSIYAENNCISEAEMIKIAESIK